jgi:hypothetical protein
MQMSRQGDAWWTDISDNIQNMITFGNKKNKCKNQQRWALATQLPSRLAVLRKFIQLGFALGMELNSLFY